MRPETGGFYELTGKLAQPAETGKVSLRRHAVTGVTYSALGVTYAETCNF